MPKNQKLAKDWESSKIRAIASTLKSFKGASVQYAYDKKQQIYSVSANLDGKPYILSLRIGPESMEMMLTDRQGNIVEHVAQTGSDIKFIQNKG
jgi:hypothetical protein